MSQETKNTTNWLRVMLAIIVVIICGSIISKIASGIDENKEKTKAISAPQPQPTAPKIVCESGTSISGKFFITKNNTDFRTGAGIEHKRITQETLIYNETTEEYDKKKIVDVKLSQDHTLEGLCETQEWLQGKIIELNGSPLSEAETGWVQKKFVSNEPSEKYKNTKADMAAGLMTDFHMSGWSSKKEEQILRKGALKILKDEPNCAKISYGSRSIEKGKYYVECDPKDGGFPFHVHFSQKDTESQNDLKSPTPFPEKESKEACLNRIRSTISHPSTINFHPSEFLTEIYPGGLARRGVFITFSAKNDFNLKLEYIGKCIIDAKGELETIEVVEKR